MCWEEGGGTIRKRSREDVVGGGTSEYKVDGRVGRRDK